MPWHVPTDFQLKKFAESRKKIDRASKICTIFEMPQFKVRKITDSHSRINIKNKFYRRLVRIFGPRFAIAILAVSFLLIVLGAGSMILDSNLFVHATREIFSFGPLQEDSNGHTNILLLGVAGEGAEGGNLSDSIMIASINPDNPSISFLSFPRDLFIDSRIGDRKVNEIYAAARYRLGDRKGLEVVKDAIEKFTGIEIHYGAVVNFQIFEEVVDALGGIDIFVPEDIDDPFYPDENYGYQTFVVRMGMQHFDGATALKYARSRKTSSDYNRAKRQQDLILAIREKAETLNFLTDFGKLAEFFQLYRKNVNTDIGLTQLVALAKIAMAMDYSNAVSTVLNDDPTQMGGFLFTPAKEFYAGQFVLLPENLQDTKLFMDLVLIHPEVLLESAQISVLNGSEIEGKASQVAARLRRLGFHVIEVGNYPSDIPVTQTFFQNFAVDHELETIPVLKKLLDAGEVLDAPLEEIGPENLIDLKIILGSN